MNEFDIFTLAGLIAIVTLLVAVGLAFGPRHGDMESLFRSPTDLGWPRGVQEEEPAPWKTELLGRSRPAPDGYAITRRDMAATQGR